MARTITETIVDEETLVLPGDKEINLQFNLNHQKGESPFSVSCSGENVQVDVKFPTKTIQNVHAYGLTPEELAAILNKVNTQLNAYLTEFND